MIPLVITIITSALEILDMVFGNNWIGLKEPIEIFLAAVTPLLVWLVPHFSWHARERWPQ
jgi:hypothetical protein